MQDISVEVIDITIQSIKKNIQDSSVEPLILALEALKQDINSEALLKEFSDLFFDLGIIQGAILTYAPSINNLLSGNIFEDDRE